MIDESLQYTQKNQHHYVYKGLFVLALCGFIGIFLALQYAPLSYWTADQNNGSQSWQTHDLEDHSQIQMAGKTAYNIDYNQKNRAIELLQGSVLVDVAKDPQRPFLVKTAYGTVQALGTRFIVTQNKGYTTVTMLESKTQVWSEQDIQHKVPLVAGQRLTISAQGIVSHQPILINANLLEQAWHQHVLVVNGENLVDVLDDLSMYYTGALQFDRQQLATLKVTATLSLDDIDQSLQQLASELKLDIKQNLPFYLSIQAKK